MYLSIPFFTFLQTIIFPSTTRNYTKERFYVSVRFDSICSMCIRYMYGTGKTGGCFWDLRTMACGLTWGNTRIILLDLYWQYFISLFSQFKIPNQLHFCLLFTHSLWWMRREKKNELNDWQPLAFVLFCNDANCMDILSTSAIW